MQNSILKEIKIKLPDDVVNTISSSEIVSIFKEKLENTKREEFADGDDLIIWEGYELAYNEWMKKYEELKTCKG